MSAGAGGFLREYLKPGAVENAWFDRLEQSVFDEVDLTRESPYFQDTHVAFGIQGGIRNRDFGIRSLCAVRVKDVPRDREQCRTAQCHVLLSSGEKPLNVSLEGIRQFAPNNYVAFFDRGVPVSSNEFALFFTHSMMSTFNWKIDTALPMRRCGESLNVYVGDLVYLQMITNSLGMRLEARLQVLWAELMELKHAQKGDAISEKLEEIRDIASKCAQLVPSKSRYNVLLQLALSYAYIHHNIQVLEKFYDLYKIGDVYKLTWEQFLEDVRSTERRNNY